MVSSLFSTGTRILAIAVILAMVGPQPVVAPVPIWDPGPVPTWDPGPLASDEPVVLAVPPNLDATGEMDVTGALQELVDAAPDGSTIRFGAGSIYRVDDGITVRGRRGLTFEGNGSTISSRGCNATDSPFLIERSQGIVIRGFRLLGDNADGGTDRAFRYGCESQAGVALYGARDVDISDVEISRVHGECVYVDADARADWSEGIWFRDSTCESNGRMAVAIAAGDRVTIERVAFRQIAMFVLDIEPYSPEGGATFVMFRDNTVDAYGLSPLFTQWFVAAEGAPGSVVHDVTITRNWVIAGAPRNLHTATEAGLATTIRLERRRNIVFTENRTTIAGAGPVLYLSHVDGVLIAGNEQPLTSGRLARFVDCSGVVFKP